MCNMGHRGERGVTPDEWLFQFFEELFKESSPQLKSVEFDRESGEYVLRYSLRNFSKIGEYSSLLPDAFKDKKIAGRYNLENEHLVEHGRSCPASEPGTQGPSGIKSDLNKKIQVLDQKYALEEYRKELCALCKNEFGTEPIYHHAECVFEFEICGGNKFILNAKELTKTSFLALKSQLQNLNN